MNMFNKYLMRPSGERRHQPRTNAESATFAVADWLKQRGLFEVVFKGDEAEINASMEDLQGWLDRSQINRGG